MTNLNDVLDRFQRLRAGGFFNRTIYHITVDVFSASELKRETNYHALTFTRLPFNSNGTYESYET